MFGQANFPVNTTMKMPFLYANSQFGLNRLDLFLKLSQVGNKLRTQNLWTRWKTLQQLTKQKATKIANRNLLYNHLQSFTISNKDLHNIFVISEKPPKQKYQILVAKKPILVDSKVMISAVSAQGTKSNLCFIFDSHFYINTQKINVMWLFTDYLWTVLSQNSSPNSKHRSIVAKKSQIYYNRQENLRLENVARIDEVTILFQSQLYSDCFKGLKLVILNNNLLMLSNFLFQHCVIRAKEYCCSSKVEIGEFKQVGIGTFLRNNQNVITFYLKVLIAL
eukprot:TRINITY_DN6036_c0_g1_i9.p1 TRINITY_DN6036_c0_g1~~TRINITY_DN6036_c0_g1_i9.p1  ORF type:complete len:278 (+),score=-3.85 TRINITY_DN6036_c0_g1_i9:733-1566(+)